eukprot:2170286-Pyramimonas_sp.AAC.1
MLGATVRMLGAAKRRGREPSVEPSTSRPTARDSNSPPVYLPTTARRTDQSDEGRGYMPTGRTNQMR